MRRSLRILVCGAVLFVTGCPRGEQPPETFPAKGQLVDQNNQPVAATISFKSSQGASFAVVATTDAEGRFELETIFGNRKIKGAPKGEYRATVMPMMGEQGQENEMLIEPIELPQTFEVKPTQEGNEFSIQVEIRKQR
ncbi:MAG: hypothetical protein KatS3mg105_1856 [Gemmatales bacterium]|nr:MAG: hypothetical protein KatS3mg105_1856 [Gemmatales bacterium]